MTQQEQDALVGKTLRELRQKRNELAELKTQADSFGHSFEQLGKWLQERPEAVAFDDQQIESQFKRTDTPPFKNLDVDLRKIIELTAEIRRIALERSSLEKTARKLGLD